MKIYSARRYKQWNLVPKFMGKDVWVLCRKFYENGSWLGNYYVKFIREDKLWGIPVYCVSVVSESLVDVQERQRDPMDTTSLNNVLREFQVLPDSFDIVAYPEVEALTTDEMLMILKGEAV